MFMYDRTTHTPVHLYYVKKGPGCLPAQTPAVCLLAESCLLAVSCIVSSMSLSSEGIVFNEEAEQQNVRADCLHCLSAHGLQSTWFAKHMFCKAHCLQSTMLTFESCSEYSCTCGSRKGGRILNCTANHCVAGGTFWSPCWRCGTASSCER